MHRDRLFWKRLGLGVGAAAALILASPVSARTVVHTGSTAVELAAKKIKEYYCPMHPEVKSEKPGECPKCGMKLEPKPDK